MLPDRVPDEPDAACEPMDLVQPEVQVGLHPAVCRQAEFVVVDVAVLAPSGAVPFNSSKMEAL